MPAPEAIEMIASSSRMRGCVDQRASLIVRESSLTVRSLVTSCRLLNATRSDNNPHGFIIEAFTITENKDLQTIKR